MDEDFEFFLENIGPPVSARLVPKQVIEKYTGVLPSQLLTYWKEYGWAGYGSGVFWVVDPEEYQPVVKAWIDRTPLAQEDSFYVIGRGAFGRLHFWGRETGVALSIDAVHATAYLGSARLTGEKEDLGIRAFFSRQDQDRNDCDDDSGEPLFERALERLGRLSSDEMYGFVPARAMGGNGSLTTLKRVKAIEHLVFLAQLVPLRIHRLPGIQS
ncbi:GAD-like domain-containing protein [Eleftheria terrae]|uniref:GAD-like domain-containing protein n=1 Tax=Eleftheria terrae TaxID=1597781 RepID=UPI00263A4FE2|nr:GAD-like domain-containing protein [Eleftheria terrae]WKB52329.1 DUF1851 domain-containing protein [Eleftheria terrae]